MMAHITTSWKSAPWTEQICTWQNTKGYYENEQKGREFSALSCYIITLFLPPVLRLRFLPDSGVALERWVFECAAWVDTYLPLY